MSLLLQQWVNLLFKKILISRMETRQVANVDRDSQMQKLKTLELVAFVTIGRYYKENSLSFSLKPLLHTAYLSMQRL